MTNDEEQITIREGWCLRHNGLSTRYIDGTPVFLSGGDVYQYVLRKAEAGSEFHKRVIMDLPLNFYDSVHAMARGYQVSVRTTERSEQLVQYAEAGDLIALKVLRAHAKKQLIQQ